MDTKDKDFFDELFDELFDAPNWTYGALLAILAVVAAVMVIGHFMG